MRPERLKHSGLSALARGATSQQPATLENYLHLIFGGVKISAQEAGDDFEKEPDIVVVLVYQVTRFLMVILDNFNRSLDTPFE